MPKWYAIHWGQENTVLGIQYLGEYEEMEDTEEEIEKLENEVGSFESVQAMSGDGIEELISDLTEKYNEAKKEAGG